MLNYVKKVNRITKKEKPMYTISNIMECVGTLLGFLGKKEGNIYAKHRIDKN